MKIVHVNSSAGGGGAAIAALRHMQAMKKAGLDAKMLVLDENSNDADIVQFKPTFKERMVCFCHRILSSVIYKIASPSLVWSSGISGYDISEHSIIKDADIIYLHWITGFVNYRGINKLLLSGKKIVLFLHDMEACTGGCHYSLSCRKYENNCIRCEQLRGLKSLSYYNQIYKNIHIKGFRNLVVASPSYWLFNCSRNSKLFSNFHNVVVKNVIDTELYKPYSREVAIQLLNLNSEKKYILFVACDVDSLYKGWSFLEDALSKIDNPDIEALVLGNFDESSFSGNIKIFKFGFVTDEIKKIMIYSVANVLVIPSIAENFPNVVVESMACGTPVVGFKTGGIVDQIHHKQNGFLAEMKDSKSLLEGILWALELTDVQQKRISNAAIDFVEKYCSFHNVLSIHKPLLE